MKALPTTIILIIPVRLCAWDKVRAKTAGLNMSTAERAVTPHKLFKCISIDRWMAVFYRFLLKYATQRPLAVPEPTTRKNCISICPESECTAPRHIK